MQDQYIINIIDSSALTESVIDIGVIFDYKFNLNTFINTKVFYVSFHFYRIRKSITFHTCKILVSNIVDCKLLYYQTKCSCCLRPTDVH